MKRKILLLCITAASLAFVGCGESSSGGGTSSNTPVSLAEPDTLKGNYEVDAFYNNNGFYNFTNDCEDMKAVASENLTCDPSQNIDLAAQARVIGDAANGYVLETKVQIWGGNFADAAAVMGDIVKANSYQYTKYGKIGINSDASGFTSSGITGRNFYAVSTDNPAAEAYGKILSDGRILLELDMSVEIDLGSNTAVPTTTYIILRKTGNEPSDMNPNNLVNADAPGFDKTDFVSSINLSGTYDVTFFGSGVENVRYADNGTLMPNSVAGMAKMYYISNDCKRAISMGLAQGEGASFSKTNSCNDDAGDKNKYNQAKLIGGKVSIKIENGVMSVTSKMQLDGVPFSLAPEDKYQFTVYDPVSSFTGVGVKGYNLDAVTKQPSDVLTENPSSPFEVSMEGRELKIHMILKDKPVALISAIVDANTLVYAKKVSDTPTDFTNDLFEPFPSAAK